MFYVVRVDALTIENLLEYLSRLVYENNKNILFNMSIKIGSYGKMGQYFLIIL